MFEIIKMQAWISGFRHLDRIEISLCHGIHALTGDSGTGKTTLLTGICWIIFGSGGSGPHRATKVTSRRGLSTGGLIRLRIGDDEVIFGRSTGTKLTAPPAWMPSHVRAEFIGFSGSSVLEFAYINGKKIDFGHARCVYFGSQAAFSSTTIVPQKLPSLLLGSGKLTQTIEELFFTDEKDSPVFYLNAIESMRQANKADAMALQGKFDALSNVAAQNSRQLERSISAVFDAFAAIKPIIIGTYTERPSIQRLLTDYAQYIGAMMSESGTSVAVGPVDVSKWQAVSHYFESCVRKRDDERATWKAQVVRIGEMIRARDAIVLPEAEFKSLCDKFETLKCHLAKNDLSWTDMSGLQHAIEARRTLDARTIEQAKLRASLCPADIAHESLSSALCALHTEEEKVQNYERAKRELQAAGVSFENLNSAIAREERTHMEHTETEKRIVIGRELEAALNSTFQELYAATNAEYRALEIKSAEARSLRAHIETSNARARTAHETQTRNYASHMSNKNRALKNIENARGELEKFQCQLEALEPVEKPPVAKRGVPHKCPSCQVDLYYDGSSLSLEGISESEYQKKSDAFVQYAQDKRRLENIILQLNSTISSYTAIAQAKIEEVAPLVLEKAPETVNVPSRPPKFTFDSSLILNTLAHSFGKYKNLAWTLTIPKPLDVRSINRSICAWKAQEVYDAHVKVHGNLSNDKPLDSRILTHLLDTAHDVNNAKNALTKAQESIRAQTRAIEKLKEELGEEPPSLIEYSKAIKLIPTIINFARDYERNRSSQKDVLAISETRKTLTDKELALVEAKDLVLRVKTAYIEKSLTLVCETVNTIMSALFDGHAQYTLTYDEKDRLMASLDFNERKDVGLTELSGGELDRYSIAVTTAFAKVRGSPFLVFDETIASLDPEKRQECIMAVKNALPNRPVIFVSHDPPVGLFEQVIDITDCISVA